MKKIIDQNFPSEIQISALDKKIYEDFLKDYQDENVPFETAVVFANISFLLSSKQLLDYLLKNFEEDLKQVANEKALAINQRREYSQVSYLGLLWPLPEEQMDQLPNDTQHVVNETLSAAEMNHKINPGKVPTFLGFLPQPEANEFVKKHILWNEDPRIAPLFYHGKFTHRIQFSLIMKAVDLGFIDFGSEVKSVADILDALIDKRNNKGRAFWNILLDTVTVVRNFEHISAGPNPVPLTKRGFKPQLSLAHKYPNDYVFGMDPYFLHSYILSQNVNQHPVLSECLTRVFCKTALEIQQIEKELGYQIYINRTWPPSEQPELVPIEDYSISGMMSRIEKVFYVNGVHVITAANIVNHRESKGKHVSADTKTKLSSFSGGFWKSDDEQFSIDKELIKVGIAEYR
jgi:hypothetical protein